MKEQLISFPTSKLAKEIGLCKYFENIDGEKYVPAFYSEDGVEFVESRFQQEDCTIDDRYFRPTQSLLQKWLREIHNLNVSVWCNACGWAWELEQTNGTHISIMDIDASISGTLTESGMFEIYEDALELGLVEALKYIILLLKT